MIRIEQDQLQWLEFELLAECPEVTHGVLTRHGGRSEGCFGSLNLKNKPGDTYENVEANQQKVKKALSLHKLFSGQQCHSATVSHIDATTLIGSLCCDGLTTQTQGLGLMIFQADCQAAIFYDPIHQALANIHCGWRGSVQQIYRQTIQHMQHTYNSKPEELLVCISPSLGPENSEFINYRTELPESFWEFQVKPHYFDFWRISEWQLLNAGILPHHIQIARIDTYANIEDYFSYRRSKICGHQATICALNL